MTPHARYRKLVVDAERLERRVEHDPTNLIAKRLFELVTKQVEEAREQMKASDNLKGLREQVTDDPRRLPELLDSLEAAGLQDEAVNRASAEIERLLALPKAKRRPFQRDLDELVARHNRLQELET